MTDADAPLAAPAPDGATVVLRHLAATLAYRAAKTLRDVPQGFAASESGPTTRRPVAIVAHMADLMAWAVTLARGESVWTAGGGDDWQTEVDRFFAGLVELDAELATLDLSMHSVEKLIQGPLADALTHVGQLAMIRGTLGAPVRPESYARATITRGRVGPDQPDPRSEFQGDASRPQTWR
jgi:hypothetical protein